MLYVAVFVLAAQLLLASVGVIYSAYALVPPIDSNVAFHWDLDTAKGFQEKVVMSPDPRFSDSPVFVLRQGTTGTFNITLTSFEKQLTVRVDSWKYGGIPPWNNGWGAGGPYFRTPDGITYNFTPSNITIAPSSRATVTMRITAAPDAEIRSYNLSVSLYLKGIEIEERGYSSILTIVKGNTSTTTTSTNTACTSSFINRTTTITVTSTRTVTVTSNNTTTATVSTAATPNLSVTTSTPSTATVSTTLTSTTTAISTEQVTEPSIYAWAIGATAIAAVLAISLLRKKG